MYTRIRFLLHHDTKSYAQHIPFLSTVYFSLKFI